MKKLLFAATALLSLIAFSSCTNGGDDNGGDNNGGSTIEPSYVNASSASTWQYLKVSDGTVTVVGSAEDADDADWAKKTDWDFAVQMSGIRTNGGASSSVGSIGGLYTFAKNTVYADITSTPSAAKYVLDQVNRGGMALKKSARQTVARVMVLTDMSAGIWERSPIFAIKSADGSKIYAVEFLSYKNDKNESGHIELNVKVIANGGNSTTDAITVDATSATEWKYFKAGDGAATLVGTAADSEDATWFAKTTWDFAIQKTYIRTNSGSSTSTNAKGGLYTFQDELDDNWNAYSSITEVPTNAAYVVDVVAINAGMPGSQKDISKQPTAKVAIMASMSPLIYKASPTFAIKSADGTKEYKITFLNYYNSGETEFKIAEL